MTGLEFTHDQLPGRVVFGPGRRSQIPEELDALGASRVLIIGGSHDTATIDDLIEQIHLPVETIIGVRPHVPAEVVSDALDTVDRFKPDAVVSIGGGSSTGLAKMVARERDVRLLAIPTTYAGSEMTPIWGTSENGEKRTGRSLRVLPATVIYDPELTLGLPRSVTINSAFNALAHCVEAMWLPHTSPIAVEASIAAIDAIVDSVQVVADQLQDLDARSRLLYGAHRAGTVLAATGTGLLHKTAHVLGGMFNLDHGAMYAVLTPPMVDHHLSTIPSIAQRFHHALGPEPTNSLHALAARLDAPSSLHQIGFPVDRLGQAIEAIAQHAKVDVTEIEPVLTAALEARTEKDPP